MDTAMFYQVISLFGAVLILSAYIALQSGHLKSTSRWFSILNFVGSVLLTWVAVIDWRIGFIFLEAAWAVLSLPGIFRRTAL
jgi:Na+-translocating ferredoxin:NAD+ oxidoreductase RnfD subunit